jgi:hypothetical protein
MRRLARTFALGEMDVYPLAARLAANRGRWQEAGDHLCCFLANDVGSGHVGTMRWALTHMECILEETSLEIGPSRAAALAACIRTAAQRFPEIHRADPAFDERLDRLSRVDVEDVSVQAVCRSEPGRFEREHTAERVHHCFMPDVYEYRRRRVA